MPDQRIDDVYDILSISRQQQAVDSIIEATVEKIKKANALNVDFKIDTKTFGDYNKKLKELEAIMAKVQKGTDDAIKSSILLAKQKAAEAAAAKKVAEAAAAETKAKEAEARATERQAAASAKSAAASAKAAAAAAEQNRPYKQLALAFAAAAKKAQDLAVQYGINDKRAQAAAKAANALNNQLKAIDSTVGITNRRVGSYNETLDRFTNKLKGAALNFLALIGVTSAGAFFQSAIDEFVEMDKNVRLLQNTLRNIGVPEAFSRMENSAKRLAQQFGHLDDDEILKVFNQLTVYGKLSEDQMNQLLPVIIDFAAATGQDLPSATSVLVKALEGNARALKDYGINIKDTKNSAEAFGVIMTQLAPKVKGVAQAFGESDAGGLAKAKQDFKDLKEEIGGGLLPVLNAVLSVLLKLGQGITGFIKAAREAFTGGSFIGSIIESSLGSDEKAQDAIKKDVKANEAFINERIKQLRTLQAAGKKLGVTENDVRREYLNALVEQNKTRAATIAEIKKTGDVQDIKEVLVQFAATEQTIAALQSQLSGIKPTTADDDRNKTKTPKTKDIVEANRRAQFEILKAQLELDKEFDLRRAADERRSTVDRISNIISYGEDSQRLIEAQAAFELGAADLTAKEREKIENDKNNALIRLGTELNDKLLELSKGLADAFKVDTQTVLDGIKGMTKGIADAVAKSNKIFEDAQKKAQDNARKAKEGLRENILSLATELEGLLFDLFTNGIERQKNAIQDQIDLLEQQKQKEIEVANQTIANTAERADAIAIIEARADARRRALELRQRQLDQQKARFEKANAVANIIQSTAVAIVNALKLGPKGVALAAVIGALGAAQLVRVIAQPIPRYAEGTDNHKGGPMFVGDGGKHEGVLLPDGSYYKTPNTTTLVSAPPGTQVFPDYDKAVFNSTMGKVPAFKTVDTDATAQTVKQIGKDIVRAVKHIPQPVINAERAWTASRRVGTAFRTYLNNSI